MLNIYWPDPAKAGYDDDPRRNPHFNGAIAITQEIDYPVEELDPLQTVPRKLYRGLRIAFYHHNGWMLGFTVTEVGTRYFECIDRRGHTNVCAVYSGEWEYADLVVATNPAPVWQNCKHRVDQDKRGNPVYCNRGHLTPSCIAWSGHMPKCSVHDESPYLMPAWREDEQQAVAA